MDVVPACLSTSAVGFFIAGLVVEAPEMAVAFGVVVGSFGGLESGAAPVGVSHEGDVGGRDSIDFGTAGTSSMLTWRSWTRAVPAVELARSGDAKDVGDSSASPDEEFLFKEKDDAALPMDESRLD